jgi:hypothetical protein
MRNTQRGVSEVLGYALVFALVITTVAVVTVSGFGQLEETRNTEQLNNAERAFDLFSTNMDDITKRGAPSRSTEIRLADAQLDVANPITVSFRADYAANNSNYNVSYELWPIIYRSESSDSTIVYSGGAVFRSNGESGIAVQNPSIVAENDRIVVPLVQTRSRNAQSIGGSTTRIRATRSGSPELVISDTGNTYEKVYMNVTSPRSTLWKQMLEDYEALTCSDTSTPDKISCETGESPNQVIQISLVRVDIELSS